MFARFDRLSWGLCAVCVWVACSSPPAPGVPAEDVPLDESPLAPPVQRDAAAPEPIDCANSTGSQDGDGDGFSRAAGDCDDCQLARGPGALDIPGNGIDEDCDGEDAAAELPACDGSLKIGSTSAADAARALGLCATHKRSSYLPGLIEASWSRLNGSAKLGDARQVWLPEQFGTIAAREGERLLALSTGVARDVGDPAYTRECDVFGSKRTMTGEWSNAETPPDGYPRDEKRCRPRGGSESGPAYNDVALELTLRAPSNARSLSFDSLFLTQEYPDFVCSMYNDFFVVFVKPAPTGHQDGNVLFDEQGGTIGVNTGLLSVCQPAEPGRVAREVACAAGPALLAGTGFGAGESRCASQLSLAPDIGGASTGWLHTNVPIKPGELVTMSFVLWDMGDPLLDSTVLIDNLRWSVEAPEIGTRPINTR